MKEGLEIVASCFWRCAVDSKTTQAFCEVLRAGRQTFSSIPTRMTNMANDCFDLAVRGPAIIVSRKHGIAVELVYAACCANCNAFTTSWLLESAHSSRHRHLVRLF